MGGQMVSEQSDQTVDAGNLDWLMQGDPAIRWQTMRDLLDAPVEEWQAEQHKTVVEGWGSQLLSCQNLDGGWGEGAYSPKWTSTTYTLLTLRQIGIPRDCAEAQRGTHHMLDTMLGEECDTNFHMRLACRDRCIVGMILLLSVYFGVEDQRVDAMVENLLSERMPDGGWNCRRAHKPFPHHSSFHTTLNVLEGLREYLELRDSPLSADVRGAEKNALELLLQHRLYCSDKTGEVIPGHFTLMAYPYYWFYDYLRALDYFARVHAPVDSRLEGAIGLLRENRRADGHWPNQYHHAGKTFFSMDGGRQGSRWNTLRALRVLRWWEKGRA
jgi:hypothetical protein